MPSLLFPCRSTVYELPARRPAASVKFPSGAEPVLAQFLDERGTAHVQQPRGLRDRAVGLFEGLADESDLDRGQMILEIDPAVPQGALARRVLVDAFAGNEAPFWRLIVGCLVSRHVLAEKERLRVGCGREDAYIAAEKRSGLARAVAL